MSVSSCLYLRLVWSGRFDICSGLRCHDCMLVAINVGINVGTALYKKARSQGPVAVPSHSWSWKTYRAKNCPVQDLKHALILCKSNAFFLEVLVNSDAVSSGRTCMAENLNLSLQEERPAPTMLHMARISCRCTLKVLDHCANVEFYQPHPASSSQCLEVYTHLASMLLDWNKLGISEIVALYTTSFRIATSRLLRSDNLQVYSSIGPRDPIAGKALHYLPHRSTSRSPK